MGIKQRVKIVNGFCFFVKDSLFKIQRAFYSGHLPLFCGHS